MFKLLLFIALTSLFSAPLGKFADDEVHQQYYEPKSKLQIFEEGVKKLGCDSLFYTLEQLVKQEESSDSKKTKKFYRKVQHIVDEIIIEKDCYGEQSESNEK